MPVKCPDCDLIVRMKSDGNPYKHLCLLPNPDPSGPLLVEADKLLGPLVRGPLLVDADKLPKEFEPTEFGPTVQEMMSAPAPTVDVMDDETHMGGGVYGGFETHKGSKESCSGPDCGPEPMDDESTIPAEHQPGRPPTPAEVSYWQQQARDAAARHMEKSESDTPYVALLKEELSVPDVFTGPAEPTPGPWFDASYPGSCSRCFDRIEEGDHIRADGEGGYECEDCGENDAPETDAWERSDLPAPANTYAPVPDAFTGPAEPVPATLPTPDQFMDPAEPEVELNVSGQPPARRDYLKRYIVIDPDLGDFRRTKKERKPFGITRATTFNKHAQNTIALNGWSKRNVVMGASLRPDILRRAHGLHHDKSKEERETLDRIVDELETAAGAKVAADEGTFLHGFCDQVDAGLKTWQDAPKAYQQDIKRYVEALEAKGLEPVPGLIERTTFIREYGGVAGTFDRIFYHRPSGQYIVGDLKTGKTMKYALDETECQIWTYAHGVNQTGIYDWNTDTWERAWPDMTDRDPDEYSPITVSETVGVIVHMPVQGPEAGEVYLRFADLERGRAYAELNNAVKSYEKSKVRPFEMPSAAAQGEPWHDAGGGVEVRHSVVEGPAPAPRFKRDRVTGPWLDKFSTVASREDANRLYREAKAAGLSEAVLRLCVDLGKETLSRVDTSS